MGKRSEGTGIGPWFLGKLIRSPATWTGAVLGSLSAYASLQANTPTGGAIGFGLMVGLGTAGITYLILEGIKASYRKSQEGAKPLVHSGEQISRLEMLRESGHENEAELLHKLIEEQEALLREAAEKPEQVETLHFSELGEAIVRAAFNEIAEFEDLSKRVSDPLLKAPQNAGKQVELIRSNWAEAYGALADARSQLRKGELSGTADLLEAPDAGSDLASLIGQLREETAVSERVSERIQTGSETRQANPIKHQSGVVFDDREERGEADSRELE